MSGLQVPSQDPVSLGPHRTSSLFLRIQCRCTNQLPTLPASPFCPLPPTSFTLPLHLSICSSLLPTRIPLQPLALASVGDGPTRREARGWLFRSRIPERWELRVWGRGEGIFQNPRVLRTQDDGGWCLNSGLRCCTCFRDNVETRAAASCGRAVVWEGLRQLPAGPWAGWQACH